MSAVRRTPTLLGLDLAWAEHNPSGAVRLERAPGGGWRATESCSLGDDARVLAWVEERAPDEPALLAIDASLIAPNPPGTGRPCDRAVSSRFARFHAGAYPANRERCARPIRLAAALVRRGWSLDPHAAGRGEGRYALEVFPHAASIGLLGLERIVEYKKGPVAARRAGLARLQRLLHERLPQLDPPVRPFASEDVDAKRGKALKDLEDRLDALLCAAMAARLRGSPRECEVLGDLETGYILVPRLARPGADPGEQLLR